MEKMYEELDEAKAEIEKLKADLKCRIQLSENLKRAHHDQLIQIQQASSKIEKQAEELNDKSGEISEIKQLCEDLQSRLNEKESIIRRLGAANDKLRSDGDERHRKWEDDKRELMLSLDEANEKNIDQEQRINVLMAENEGLKGHLSATQKKCSEAEKKAKASKELRERDSFLLKLEEESRKVEDQLKWKREQFQHLEEAHRKLRDEFKKSKKEWELEKSKLIDEVCSLQTSLDSQIRVTEDLQKSLKFCNQALAHEESRRKCLEVELSDFKTRFENVFTEYEDAKSQLECLTAGRDKEIADLRHSLSTKETFYKELEYGAAKLKQENEELLASLKELRESRILEGGNSSSLSKLRNKLRSVEQMHRDCSSNLRAKEAEWNSQLEKLGGGLNDYRSALERKEIALKELEMEMENCHSIIMQLKMRNEEISITLLVLKSGINEARLNLRNAEAEMSFREKERDESISVLKKQLEMKEAALARALTEMSFREKERDESISVLKKQLEMKEAALASALTDASEEHQKAASLLKRVESLDLIEEQKQSMQKELDRYEELLDESFKCHLCFKEQALQTESDLREKLEAACASLDVSNSELIKEREKAASLQRQAESLDLTEEKRLFMEKELERYKKMLEESSRYQVQTEKQALQTESDMTEKLREVCDELDRANSALDEQLEGVACLSKRAESLDLIEEQQVLMQKELERYKEMLEESSRQKLQLEEKASLMETDLKEKLRKVSDALETAKFELAEEHEKAESLSRRVQFFDQRQLVMQEEIERHRLLLETAKSELTAEICEGHAIDFELWIWKSIAQRLKDDLEENQALRKELEASLLAQTEVGETIRQEKDCLEHMLEVKESSITSLQQQIALFKQEQETIQSVAATAARTDTLASFESERENFLQMMTEKEKILEGLEKEIGCLEQESLRRELEGAVLVQIGAERTFEHEKESLIQLVEAKDQRIEDLLLLVGSLEEKLNNSLISFSSELSKKQAEIGLVHEAWEKISAAGIMAQLEIEEKKLMIAEMEDDIHAVQQRLESQEISLSYAKQQALETEAELESKQSELRNLTDQLEIKLRASEAAVDETNSEKRKLVEDVMNLSCERENLLGFIVGVGDRISQLSNEDMQLTGALERIVQSLDSRDDSELFDRAKENRNGHHSPAANKFQPIVDERLPFRERN